VAILHPRAIHSETVFKFGIILREVTMEGLHLEVIDLRPHVFECIGPLYADRGLTTLPNELDTLVLGRLVAPVEVIDHLLYPGG
jgi:hypothetical protein